MRPSPGYTITELMVAVVIIGVLATIAIPTYTNYVYRGRVTEATTFLGEIKQRQESYRSEFGRYVPVDGVDWGTWNPANVPGEDLVLWDPSVRTWSDLGAAPDGPIRFRYATIAGVPGQAAPATTNLDVNDHWFAARAEGDLNGDGGADCAVPENCFFLEIYSQADHIFNSASGNRGWE